MADASNTRLEDRHATMVERVAKALCDADTLVGYPPWEILTPNEYEHYRVLACAAIGAMAEPSESIVKELRFVSAPYPKCPDASQVWEHGKRHVRAFCAAFARAALADGDA